MDSPDSQWTPAKIPLDRPTPESRDSYSSELGESAGGVNGLRIPVSRDGFFGYSEEKSLQQVRFLMLSLVELFLKLCRIRSKKNTGLIEEGPTHPSRLGSLLALTLRRTLRIRLQGRLVSKYRVLCLN